MENSMPQTPWICILTMLTLLSTCKAKCHNRIDIAIAVDTASSQTPHAFDIVKARVKTIVSAFQIGQDKTRLALISVSKSTHVVVNFDDVTSLDEFNAAIDRLTFSTDRVDLSEGMKIAKDSVLMSMGKKVSRVLILVKDRSSLSAAVSHASVLSRMTAYSAAIRTSGIAIHAVGMGGLWNRLELEALYGTGYLLFRNQSRALKSIKSLNKLVCEVVCTGNGTSSQIQGLCYRSLKHVINAKVDLLVNSAGLTVCRTEISREFKPCSVRQTCDLRDRFVGSCDSNGKVTIENTWQSFDYKVQSCVTNKATTTVTCVDAMKCQDQVADILFVLDRSGSIGPNFPMVKRTTKLLIAALDVGPKNVRVGVITYTNQAITEIGLAAHSNRDTLLAAVDDMTDTIVNGAPTYTHLGLELARETFNKQGRPEVPRYVFVITDGDSNYPYQTIDETARIKSEGVTLYAIGVGTIYEPELRLMAAPDVARHLFLLTSFSALQQWSASFSKEICIELAAPFPKLCADSVFTQSISDCIHGVQMATKTEYQFNAARKCIKSIQTTEHRGCLKSKCTDPIDGNDYFEGESWTRLCHEFSCGAKGMLVVPQTSKCLAADGSCMQVGSQPFKCRDHTGALVEKCLCVELSGRVTMVMDVE